MARPAEIHTIDGFRYRIRKMDPFDALRLQAMLVQTLGGSVVRALSGSAGIKGVVVDLLGDAEGRLAGLLDGDTKQLVPLIEPLLLGLAEIADSIADRLTPEAAVAVAKLLVVGRDPGGHSYLSTWTGDAEMDIEDVDTYRQVMHERGPWHQLALLRRCVQVQLGKPSADRATSSHGQAAPAEASP
jgi:hypothetical protein